MEKYLKELLSKEPPKDIPGGTPGRTSPEGIYKGTSRRDTPEGTSPGGTPE